VAADAVSAKIWFERASVGICAVLVVGISYVLVQISLHAFDSPAMVEPPELRKVGRAGVNVNGAEAEGVDPSVISSWSLFGKAEIQKTVTTKDVEAPRTQLKLELKSVFAAEDESRSSAIIAESSKKSNLYRVGSKLPGNATLAGVYSDRVLLNRRGKIEALYFPESSAGSGTKKKASGKRSSKKARPKPGSRVRKAGGGKKSPITQMLEGTRMPKPDEITGMLKESLSTDPTGALKDLGLTANDGDGYKVSGRNPLFSGVGVSPGDVIVSINGQSVGNPQYDVGLLESAVSQPSISLVIRDAKGRTRSVQLPTGMAP